MKLFLEALQDNWEAGIGYRINASAMITLLLVLICSLIYKCGLFVFIMVLLVAIVYWLINFILKEREECYGNNKKRWQKGRI